MRLLHSVIFLCLFSLHSFADDGLPLCREAGYGYLRLAGSDLCFAPRGFVRAETIAGLRLPPFYSKSDAIFGSIAKAQIGLDFVAPYSALPNGGRLRVSFARETGWPTIWSDGIGGQRNLIEVDEAWMRLGPVMAGRGPSRFDFYRDSFNYTPLPISDLTANFVALRVPLTSWLYAEGALEDAYERVNGLIAAPSGKRMNKPDLVGVLRAAIAWPYPAELQFSIARPQSMPGFMAWQMGAAFDLGGERPHLLIVQIGQSRGPPSFIGIDRGLLQAVTGADVAFNDTSALRGTSAALVYRRPIWNERWTVTNFAGFAFMKPVLNNGSGLVGPAALMMAGGNLEWRSRQGLMIGAEFVYVISETPATPYTRYGEAVVFRLRIEKGF